MLVRNQFDFVGAAKEFQRYLNSNELADSSNDFYKIDSKKLQLKWTDIEIRRHVIPTLNQEEEKTSDDEDEDELPPLEQPSPDQLEREIKTKQIEQIVNRETQSSSPELEADQNQKEDKDSITKEILK